MQMGVCEAKGQEAVLVASGEDCVGYSAAPGGVLGQHSAVAKLENGVMS